MLATEPTPETPSDGAAAQAAPSAPAQPAAHPPLETWAYNEPMRHIPSAEWMIRKVDVDLRRRSGKLLDACVAIAPDDPRRAGIDEHLRGLCRALERVADVAKHGRAAHPPAEPAAQITWGFDQAVANLRTVEGTPVGRRYPVQTFERSKAEPLYAAVLLVISRLEQLTTLVREFDRDIDARLLEDLVSLENPIDERMLRPIA